MKRLILIAFCCCAMLACTKDKNTDEPNLDPNKFYGSMQVKYNNVRNISTTYCRADISPYIATKLGLNFYLSNRERLGIMNIENKVDSMQFLKRSYGNQELTSAIHSTTDLSAGDDVSCDYYDPYQPDSLQNWVKITQYNSTSKEIWG